MKANLSSVNWELTGPLPSHRQGNGRAGKGRFVCMWKGHRGDRDNGKGTRVSMQWGGEQGPYTCGRHLSTLPAGHRDLHPSPYTTRASQCLGTPQ